MFGARVLLTLLSCSSCLACGGKWSHVEETRGGGGGVGGSAAGMGQGAVSSGGAAPDCASLVDDPPWLLLVQFSNQTSRPIHFGPEEMNCSVVSYFEIRDATGSALPGFGNCPVSCERAIQNDVDACFAICPGSTTLTLEPGQASELRWDGRYAEEHDLARACVPDAYPRPPSCVRSKLIEPGTYTVALRFGDSRDCSQTASACECTPQQHGGCTTPGSLITGTIETAEIPAQLDPTRPDPSGQPAVVGVTFEE